MSPELPESPLWASPLALAGPVLPESASPEPATVRLPASEPASPEEPPKVALSALESPEEPPSAVVSGFEQALPVSPVAATVVTEGSDEPSWSGATEGSTSGPPPQQPEVISGSALACPESPEELDEEFEAVAEPPAPVVPEVVVELVSALPEVAVELAVEVVVTAPVLPPSPESPEVAVGAEVAQPVVVEPEEPVSPVEAESVEDPQPE